MNLSEIYPLVMPEVPSCPAQTVLTWVRQAAIEFYERSLVWAVDLADTLSDCGTLTFTAALTAAQSGTLNAVWTGTTGPYFVTFDSGDERTVTLTNGATSATWSGVVTAGTAATYSKYSYPITFPSNTELAKLLEFTIDRDDAFVVTPTRGRELWRQNSGVDAVWTEDQVNFLVNPKPSEVGLVYGLRAALKPSATATTITDPYGTPYKRHIAAGAKSMLFAMPGQPWSNVLRAKEQQDHFDDLIAQAYSKASKGFGRGAHRVRARFF